MRWHPPCSKGNRPKPAAETKGASNPPEDDNGDPRWDLGPARVSAVFSGLAQPTVTITAASVSFVA